VEPTPQPTGGGTTLPPMGGSGASRGAHAAAATSAASTAAAASSAASPGIIRQYNATPRWQLNYTHLQKNPISCGYGANGTSQEIQIQQTEPKKVPLPKDYEIITKPFKFTCEGNDLDLTLNLPEDYTDIRAYRCDKECKEILERTSDRTNLTCGGKSLKEITLESLQKIKRVEPFEHINATKILTQEEPTISIAGYKITLHLQKTTTIELNTPKKQLPPPTNPSLGIIGTPLEVNIEDKQTKIPAIIQLPFTTTETNPETIAIFVKTGNGWKYLGGQTENNTITLQIEDINQYSNATFAVMGLLCLTCKQTDSKIPLATKKPILTKVYDPGVTDAIILVHGFGAAATWQPFIDDYVINEQPWQLWVLSYPTTNTVEENSLAFSDLLEQNHYQFERATIVAHSLGTLLTRQSLNDAHTQPEKYHFLPKIKQTILISGPGEGTPTIDAIKNIITRFINEPSALSLFNLNPFVEKDLRYGKNIPTTPKIDYYVLAGTMPYWFNIELFKNITYAQNDGIVSTRSAQKVGDNYVNNTCKNYYEINLSHMELNDHELSRKIIEGIITQTQNKKHEQALIGKNQYFRLILKNCTTSESIYVVGKPIPPKAAPDPTGCGCGNGVCGIDETETSCPSDCAKVVTVESTCLLLPLPIITLLILSTLLLIIILLRKHLFAHDIALIWYIIEYTLIAITTTLVVYETLSCSERLIFPPYILALIAILTFTDTIIKKQELTPSLNKIIKRKIANVQKIHNKLEKLSNKYEQERKPETRQKYQTLKEINEKINTITRTVHKQLKRFK
jgi:pimeloyl-ACP methyl ester carboxylesterase